jgi:hypothetical protein
MTKDVKESVEGSKVPLGGGIKVKAHKSLVDKTIEWLGDLFDARYKKYPIRIRRSIIVSDPDNPKKNYIFTVFTRDVLEDPEKQSKIVGGEKIDKAYLIGEMDRSNTNIIGCLEDFKENKIVRTFLGEDLQNIHEHYPVVNAIGSLSDVKCIDRMMNFHHRNTAENRDKAKLNLKVLVDNLPLMTEKQFTHFYNTLSERVRVMRSEVKISTHPPEALQNLEFLKKQLQIVRSYNARKNNRKPKPSIPKVENSII